jgi:hypothetical protein
MGSTFYKLNILALGLVFTSCVKQSDETSQGFMRIGMSSTETLRESGSNVPAVVLLTVEDSKGNKVIDYARYDLFIFGSGYLSESAQLAVGQYKLIEFVVLSGTGHIIYASPVKGSQLAQYVERPLPLDFTVTAQGTTTVVPQVIAVSQETTPEQFGYVNFGFEVVDPYANPIKECETFVFDFNKNTYVPHTKVSYTYEDQMLIKKEYRRYLVNYHVYYIEGVEVFKYGSGSKLQEVELYYGPENKLLTKYMYSYPDANTIVLDIYGGYLAGHVTHDIRRIFSTNGTAYTHQPIEHPGRSSESSDYLLSGVIDSKGNMSTETMYYKGDIVWVQGLTGYDMSRNPLRNFHDYLKDEDPLFYSANNPLVSRFESANGNDWTQYEYTYEYDQIGNITSCWIEIKNNVFGLTNKSRVEFRY